MTKYLPALTDLLERSFATFWQSFFAVYIVNHGKLSEVAALETAAVAGALAVGKYLQVKANAFLAKPAPAASPLVFGSSSGSGSTVTLTTPVPVPVPKPAPPKPKAAPKPAAIVPVDAPPADQIP